MESLLEHDDAISDGLGESQLEVVREALAGVLGTSGAPAAPGDRVPTGWHPQTIGGYRILRLMGEGGMGVVYEAQQQSPQRTVALKVIRPGLASPTMLRRFQLEAEMLGSLQHPGIAHIYEAGVAEVTGPAGETFSQPFFAMELVRGKPLRKHVEGGKLSVRSRVELMARICDAVEHAHAKGVIHRDLKPSNILVDEGGQPKILDFGVARATNADLQTTLKTDVGQLLGTIPYMSPEQVAGDPESIDPRCDVYALGVILYEALAGRLPYDVGRRTIPEAARIIQHSEPERLGSVNTAYRGDLDTIVAKALEKEKQRRYASAAELAADLRRYLASEPILARPASTFYQFRKFARRNQAAVIGAAAVFVVLVAGIVATSVGMLRARRAETLAGARLLIAEAARRDAEESRGESEAVNRFLADMLTQADPARSAGHEVTVREVLDDAAAHIDDFANGHPRVEAAIRHTIGQTYAALGRDAEATPHLRSALALREELLGTDDPDTQQSLYDLGDNLLKTNEMDEAEALARGAIAKLRAGDPRHPELLARQLYVLGRLHKRRAEYGPAADALGESVAIFRAQVEGERGMANALAEFGNVLSRQGDQAGAENALREALEIATRLHGGDSPHAAGLSGNLAVILKRQGRLAEAEPLYRQALEIQKRTHGPTHPGTMGTMVNLGSLLIDQGKPADAETLLREAVAAMLEVHGEENFNTAVALGLLARTQAKTGALEEAEATARRSLTAFRRTLGDRHPYTATAMNGLASVLIERGAFAEAEPILREALETSGAADGATDAVATTTLVNLGEVLHHRAAFVEAEELFKKALDIFGQRPEGAASETADCLAAWADMEYTRENRAHAEELYLLALDTLKQAGQAESSNADKIRGRLDACRGGVGKRESEKVGK